MNQLEKQVLRLIPIGKDRPRPVKEIAQAVKVSERTTMDIVARLIIKYKVPIIGERGDKSGYFIPANETERLEGLKSLENQTKEQLKRLNVATYCSLTEWQKYLKEGEDDESNSTPN